MKQFKRNNKHLLKKNIQIRNFYEMVLQVYYKPEIVESLQFRQQLKESFQVTSSRDTDMFMFNFCVAQGQK